MQLPAFLLRDVRGLAILLCVCVLILAVGAGIFSICGKRDRLGPLLLALAFVELSCVFIFMTFELEEMDGMESSSKLVPYLWSIPLLCVSVIQFIRVWRSKKTGHAGHGRLDKVFFTFLVVAVTIYQFRTLGFFLSTTAMLVLLMLLFGERRIILIAGTAVFWVLFTWLVFNKLLLLGLPSGTLFASFV